MIFGYHSPEFVRLNAYRKSVGMPVLPTDEELNNNLFARGFTMCFDVTYPFPGMVPKK